MLHKSLKRKKGQKKENAKKINTKICLKKINKKLKEYRRKTIVIEEKKLFKTFIFFAMYSIKNE